MPKGGLFAGEVTQAAPADGASTEKQKGFQWMEHGYAFAPTSSLVTSTGGTAATNVLRTTTEFTHPFAGQTYPKFFMSFVGQMNSKPDTGESSQSVPFNLAEFSSGMRFYSDLTAGQVRMKAVLVDQYDGNWLMFGSNNIDTGWDDWWWHGLSFNYTDGIRQFHSVNLETGQEISASITTQRNEPLSWKPKATSDGTGSSVCNWGFSDWAPVDPNVSQYWKGDLSQVLIHNDFIDLTVDANRRKFCALDGVVSYGNVGQLPFGVKPLVYLPNGHPSSNVGSLHIGNWDADFYIAKSRSLDINIPPIGT